MTELSREQQLELAVKFTMKWLEEVGGIAVSGKTRQACVSELIDDTDTAILDVACERALAGTLSESVLKEMTRLVYGFNYRSLISGDNPKTTLEVSDDKKKKKKKKGEERDE